MKFLLKPFFLFLLIFQFLSVFSQTIRVANNNPNAPTGTNVYTTLAAAIAAASSDDIIHVMPSSISYGDVVIDKKLTVYGIGINPDKEGGQRSIINSIDIKSSVASGTKLSGIVVSTLELCSFTGSTYTLNNIVIEYSQIGTITQYSVNLLGGLIIRNCVLGNSLAGISINLEPTKHSGVVVTNNIIGGQTNGTVIADNNTTFTYNIFFGAGGANARKAFYDVDNCIFRYNIFYGRSTDSNSGITGSTFINNISFNSTSTLLPATGSGNTGTGNLAAVDPLFENFPLTDTWDYGYNASLKAGSPGKGLGESGTDVGIFGGPTPWKISGTPLPIVQSLSAPSVVIENGTLQIKVKAKGN